jgi:hypothetical protein
MRTIHAFFDPFGAFALRRHHDAQGQQRGGLGRSPLPPRRLAAAAARDGALCFDSAGYYVECRGFLWRGRRHCAWRVALPDWFLPKRTCVAHRDLDHGTFRFTMTIRHTLLGDLFSHDGVFRSVE